MTKDDRTECSGLWEYVSQNDNTFFAGNIRAERVDEVIEALKDGRTRFLMHPKTDRQERQPSFDLYLVEPRKRKEE